jgi:glucosamine--fructose-6-phosphate aminotransferase (isomerizing)
LNHFVIMSPNSSIAQSPDHSIPRSSNLFREHILSLPELIEQLLPVFENETARVWTPELCASLSRVYVVGCGDSHHASLASELAFEQIGGVPCEPMTAMQFSRYASALADVNGAVIGVSVSGGVTRTIESVLRAQKRGLRTIAITSSNTTPIGQAAQHVLTTRVPDVPNAQGVIAPGARSYFASLLMLMLSAIQLGERRGAISAAEATRRRTQLRRIPDAIRSAIQHTDADARDWAQATLDARELVFCGSGPSFATALYCAAKTLEACGDPAIGQDMEEWAHLQYFAKVADTPTFVISTPQFADASRASEIVVAAQTLGRRVKQFALPQMDEVFSPFVSAIPHMLFIAHRAELMHEPYFRAFGGGRSIEGGGGISRIRTSELVA